MESRIGTPLVFILGLAAGGTIAMLLAPRPLTQPMASEAAATSERAPIDWDGVRTDLAGLQRSIQALESRVAGWESNATRVAVPAPSGARASGDQAVMERLEKVEQLLQRTVDSIDEPRVDLAALKREKPEPDWSALERLLTDWSLDEERVAKEHHFLQREGLLEKYGSPTGFWHNDKGTHWTYGKDIDPVTGEAATEVWFCFQGGYLTMLDVRMP